MLGAVWNRDFVMAALATVSRAAVAFIAMSSFGAHAAEAAEAESHAPATKPVCLSASDTRDQVKAHKLLEPYAALKFAAQQRKAEALSAKLCLSGDDFVYEITLLHRDGKLIHVEMDAGTGKPIARPSRDAHETPPRDAHEPKEGHDAHEQPVKN